MEFEENHVADFLRIFAACKDQISSFPGCMHLQLLQDEADSRTFFTYSHWAGQEDLASYRNSQLFDTVWGETKKLFRKAPQAWSLSDLTGAIQVAP